MATALGVAGGFSRVMALPAVQRLLPSWLRTSPPPAPDMPPAAQRWP